MMHRTVAGSAVVHNDGEILLGSDVTFADTPEPVKLLTKPGAVLELGDGVHVDGGTTIAAFGRVRVGNAAQIGARCLVLDDQSAAGIEIGAGAVIEDEVMIVAGAMVAAGARVPRGTVVCATPAPTAGARTTSAPAPQASPTSASPTSTSAGHASTRRAETLLDEVRATVARVLPKAADAPAGAELPQVADWTSLAEVQIIVALEERFGIILRADALVRSRTLDAITEIVAARQGHAEPGARSAGASAEPPALVVGPSERSARSMTRRLLGELRYMGSVAPSRICVKLANLLPQWSLPHLRRWLLRAAGCRVANGSAFLGQIALIGPPGAATQLEVQEGCVIGLDVTFGLDAPITLGRNVSVGPRATIYTGTHAVGRGESRMDSRVVARPVVIEDGAWIGMCALILPGVRIGAGAVVSAGAVVTSDVPAHTLVAGNPAVPLRTLPI